MSIINTQNIKLQDQKLFLGPTMGLQRYDKFKYPVFFDLFKKQMEFMWRPEEISLVKDKVDYETLEPHEKHIFTSNLLFQTMLDSIVARGVPTFLDKITNPELEACCSAWQFFETIHSYSYTYIIKNLYPDPTQILDSALENPEILARSYSVKKAYDDLNEAVGEDQKAKIYLALISVNMLEAVRFYVSFVCAFAFGENKKMIGNADIIRLIRRDEACVSEDTEILTTHGWAKFDSLTEDMMVAQYTHDGNIEFVNPTKIVRKQYNGDMIHFTSDKNHIDMLLTPDHRVVYRTDKNELREKFASDFKPNSFNYIPTAGKIDQNNNIRLSDYERFLIALQADGSICNQEKRNGKISGCHTVMFSFAKNRKIERLKDILHKLGFDYTLTRCEQKNQFVFRVKVPIEFILYKDFSWVNINNLSLGWCQDFIEEVVCWDGHIRGKESYYYSSVIELNTEKVQTIACLAGYATHRYIQKDNRKASYKIVHRLSILKYKNKISGQIIHKNTVPYSGNVYCVSVPSGMFVARRNNIVYITGNCHLYTTQNILNIIRENKDEGFQQTIKDYEEEAIKIFSEGAKEEKAWASYLFKDGSILGLNEKILCQYIEWLTDSRMIQIGLPKLFNAKKPSMSWIEPWMDSSAVQVAPQESEITTYKIAASNSDLKDADFSDCSL